MASEVASGFNVVCILKSLIILALFCISGCGIPMWKVKWKVIVGEHAPSPNPCLVSFSM